MHGRSRLGNGHGGGVSSPRGGRRGKGSDRRLVHWAAAAAFRRRGALLMAPLVYLALMLVFVGRWEWNLEPPVPVRVGVAILRRAPPPGSVYQSPQVFQKLWPFMQADVNHSSALMTAWHQKATQKWKPCLQKRLLQAELPPSNGFLIIEANGGLNQQRLSICDAVAVAGLLNATLVIPIFHFNSVWRDSSKFGDIFDEEYFTEKLKNHVRVVKELPQDILQRFDNNMSNILNMRSKALSSKTYYLQKVLPKLLEWGAVRIAPFSNRLAHSVPSSIQGLRCFTNYEALHFSQPIRALAERMVNRMVNNSSINGGKYISVHLRFEVDMVAFSCCTYNGGQQEKNEMDKAREMGWRGKFHKPGRVISPEANRRNGRCPLTPLEVLQQLDLSKIIKLSCQLAQVSMDQHTPCQKAMAHAMQIRVGGVNIEVGMMLRGMGFGNTTSVYVASGKIYNAEKYMAPLRQLFPLLETKDTLASADELAPFKGHSSQLAALDYTVCAHSEVFVTTQGGNFAHFLMGHRRYLNEGHSKTINPDKKKLVLSFDNPNIRWEKFKRNMQEVLHHSDLKGISLRKPDASLYTFPMPDCMCQQAEG